MDKFLGYAPDADPSLPGVLTDVTNMVPTIKGMKGAATAVSAGVDALAAESRGVAVLTKLDSTRRTFAGTATKLYEASGTTWTDVSRAGNYTVGAEERWLFAQFGDVTLAATKSATLQYSNGSGAFADISGAPKAKLMAVSQGFVMLADTNEVTYGDQSDRFWCSAYLDYSDWTPNVQTECVTGRLVDSPGPIFALEALGAGFVAYKRDSIFIGSYVGAPAVWDWNQVPGYVGVLGKDCVINAGYAHYFLGTDDFFMLDGTRPVSIGENVREWFFANMNPQYAYKTQAAYDEELGNCFWWYVPRSNGSGTLTSAIVFNVKTQKWGKVTMTVESVAKYVAPGVTYHGLGTNFSTYADLPNGVSYNSSYWTANTPVLSVIKDDHILYTLSGASTSCSLQTGVIGDDQQMTQVSRVKPRFVTKPTSATLESQFDNAYGTSFTTHTTVSMGNNGFDFLKTARWHRFVETFVGPVEILGQVYDIKPAGLQ